MIAFTLLVAWALITFGLTYLVSTAEITEPIRVRVAAYFPFIILLLTCRACTGFWTGMVSAAITMGIASGQGISVPWHSWIYIPIVGGIASVGLIDLIAFAKHGDLTAFAQQLEMQLAEVPPPKSIAQAIGHDVGNKADGDIHDAT